MRSPKRALWLVGAWLAATAATAGVALAVVGLAGDKVGDEAVRPLSAVEVEALGVTTVPAATTTAAPASTTVPASSSSTDATNDSSDPTGTTAPPATTAAPGTTEPPPTTAAPATTTTTAEAQVDSRQVTGGTVVVRWTATSVELVSASPVDGYTVEVKDRGPGKVEVEFEGGATRTHYRAEVSGGRLDVEVSVEDEDD